MRYLLFIFCISLSCLCFGKTYSVSNNGKEFIKNNEKLMLKSYWDSNGYSIGYGHHSKEIKKNQKINKHQANKYFTEDINEVNKAINRMLGELNPNHNFSQSFIDGLGDLVYNCGVTGVKKSDFWTVLKRCRVNNKKDLHFAISYVKTCRLSSPGHKDRRYKTMKLMLS